MKRYIVIALFVILGLPVAFLLFMRFWVLPSEGYPTWEAVRNILVRDGEIVITFPERVTPLAARCDDRDSSVSINGRSVITKIGYSWCVIEVDAARGGETITYTFNPQKLNNWNRMRFEPVYPSNPNSSFKKFENGVLKTHSDVSETPTANDHGYHRAQPR